MQIRNHIEHINFALTTSGAFRVALVGLALLAVSACGGGGGGALADSGGVGGTGISTGVMTKGSVVLNGVRYEDATAIVSIDDNTSKTAADLRNGMVVQVRGSVNADGVNGTATRVEAQIEVRGTVTVTPPAANPQRFLLLGQDVIVDDLTEYSNLPNKFADIVAGTLVEVHGLRDTAGAIRATRIEANQAQMGDSNVDEIRGVVIGGAVGPNPAIFTLGLGGQPVNATGAIISPAGAIYQNDSVIEVHCSARPCLNGSGQFQASRIEVESAEDAIFIPGLNERFEVEGIVSGLTIPIPNRLLPSDPPPALSFSVAGVSVTTSGSTQFKGGIYEDMGNDIKVEAEGTWNGSVLVANKIEFKRSVIRLQGFVTSSTPLSSTFTLTIASAGSVDVEADSFTSGDFSGGIVPPVSLVNCIQVRAQRKADVGVVVLAGEIKDGCSGSSGTRHLIQAPVEDEVGTILTLLGLPVDVGSPSDGYQGLNNLPLTSAEFFAAVTAATDPGPPPVGGTLVKISFDGSAVKEVELED